MIKAIFFDLDGTIRHNEPRGSDIFAEHAAQLGLRIRDDDRLRAMRWEHYYWALSHELLADRTEFNGQEGDFWKRYSHRQLIALGASTDQAMQMAARMAWYMSDSYKPRSVVPEDLIPVLRALNDAGRKLAVISNRDKPIQEEMEQLGLAQYFSFSLASGEIRAWKPEPEIFLHACRRIEAEPAESVYVGDNWFADVVGAKRAGVTPVLYDPRGIFDDPECAVIHAFADLPRVLNVEGVDIAPRDRGT